MDGLLGTEPSERHPYEVDQAGRLRIDAERASEELGLNGQEFT